MGKPKYPYITVELTGTDSNAFLIMGRVTKELKKQGVDKKEIEEYRRQAMSGDYDNLLRVTMEWVDTE